MAIIGSPNTTAQRRSAAASTTITARSGPKLYAQVAAANHCYFPAGTYTLDRPLTYDSNVVWEGDGVRNTILQVDGDVSAIKSIRAGTPGASQFFTLKGMSIHGRAGNKSPLLDCRNTQYMTLEDIEADGDPTGKGHSAGPIIDNTRGGATFNGYNVLRSVYAIRGAVGYQGEVNQLQILGGCFNANSVRGIQIVHSACVSIIGAEASGNGGTTATYSGDYPTGHYDRGGIFCDGTTGVFVRSVWHENNANRVPGQASANDLECTASCSQIDAACSVWYNANPGKFHGLGLDQGQDYGYGKAIRILSSGKWVAVLCSPTPSLTLPVSGMRLTASSSVPKFYQEILSVEDCKRNIGKLVVAKFWANAVSAPAGGICCVGISREPGGAVGGGSYSCLESSPGQPQWMTLRYAIKGDESNGLRFGAEFSGTGAIVEIGNVNVTLNGLD